MPTKTDQLKSILQLLGTSATRAEVESAFKEVIKYVQDLKRSNEQEWNLIHSAVSMLEGKVKREMEGNVHIQEIKSKVTQEIKAALTQHQKTVENKLALLKDGEDGADGRTPTEGELRALILSLIPQVRDGKDAVIDEEKIIAKVVEKIPKPTGRIGWGAHPLVIAQSGTIKEKIARHINFTGATVSRSLDGIVTVAVSGSGSGYQVPTGSVDGSNAVFVFSTAPSSVSVDGVIKRKTSSDGTVNWTGTTTITLTVAPNFDIHAIA